MDQTKQDDLAGTVGADVGRLALLGEIIGNVDGLAAATSDDDLDRWWGVVEIDRLASGLTLAAIAKLSRSSGEDGPHAPWIEKSDETGDEPTTLTPAGRDAIRRIGVVQDAARDTRTVDTIYPAT